MPSASVSRYWAVASGLELSRRRSTTLTQTRTAMGSRRPLTLTIYDGGIPVTKLWLESTVPISMSYSTEPDGGRMVLVETVVFDYTALQRLSV